MLKLFFTACLLTSFIACAMENKENQQLKNTFVLRRNHDVNIESTVNNQCNGINHVFCKKKENKLKNKVFQTKKENRTLKNYAKILEGENQCLREEVKNLEGKNQRKRSLSEEPKKHINDMMSTRGKKIKEETKK